MKKIYLLSILFLNQLCLSQEQSTAETFVKEHVEKYVEAHDKYVQLLKDLDSLKVTIEMGDLQTSFDKMVTKKKEFDATVIKLDSLSTTINAAKLYLVQNKAIDSTTMDALIKNFTSKPFKKITDTKTKEPQVYTYFGQDKVINKEIFKNKTNENEIFLEVLNTKGEKNYFGDISIPKDGQEFYFYTMCDVKAMNRIKNICNSLSLTNNKKFQFKRLNVEIQDGYFSDIKVYVRTDDGNTHLFSNRISMSILDYTHQGRWIQMLFYDISFRDADYKDVYTDNSLFSLFIKVTDVMGYDYKIGNRYIPQDITFELPAYEDNIRQTNLNSRATYEIKQETDFEKIVELRTYTDFLALFGESSNGLAQIEARAKFYLFPYPFRFFGSRKTFGQIEYLPSISPHVNYARFDNGNRYVQTNNIHSTIDVTKTNSGIYGIQKELALIEKRFLTMGVDLDILKWQHKKIPVRIIVYGLLNFNLSEVIVDYSAGTTTIIDPNNPSNPNNSTTVDQSKIRDVKASGYGVGANLITKRFNNFGFNYRLEFTSFNFKSFNTHDDLLLPRYVNTFQNEAEVFYFPNGKPNQAIFTRLITYNHRGRANNEAFYQFQFGYKFAIGSRAIK